MSTPEIPRRIISISTLNVLLRTHLEAGFPDVWVEGEVSNMRLASSGHVYLTLKDAGSQIRAVIFRSTGRYIRFSVKDGMCLICRGRVTVYESKGEYQIVIDYAEPKGIGALQVAFEQLKERLAAEGLFDAARKRSLPRFPRRLGIVTSLSGAAVRDIIQVSHKRWPNIEIIVNPVGVQGMGAAAEIARAIAEFNELSEIDILIVGRGGGSLEDLWAFNEEVVARAIAASRIPVVSAVGHEIDYTIADFVADLRAPTPSAAVELILPERVEVQNRLSEYLPRSAYAVRRSIRDRRARVEAERRALLDPAALVQRAMQQRDELELRLRLVETSRVQEARRLIERFQQEVVFHSPLRSIQHGVAMLPHLQRRLQQRATTLLDIGRRSLQKAVARAHALSPLAILARGYSITRRWPSLELLQKASDVSAGETVQVRLSSGELFCEVRGVQEDMG